MDAGLDQLARDVVMERRRHGDAGRIDPADDAAMIGSGLGAEFLGDRAGARRVGIDHGDQLRARVAGIMIGMEAAEIAGAQPQRCELDLPCALYRSALLGRMRPR